MAKPNRILLITPGIPSYNNALIELGNQLKREGVEMITVSHIDMSSLMDRANLPFILLKDDIIRAEKLRTELESIPRSSILNKFRRLRIRSKHRAASLENDELQGLIEQLSPDILLIDMECHKAIILTYKLDTPTILLSLLFNVFRFGHCPPLHLSNYPPTTSSERILLKWLWFKTRVSKITNIMLYRFSQKSLNLVPYITNSRSDLRSLARANELSLRSITEADHWLVPHVYKKYPYLSLTAKELDFGPDGYDPRLQHIGPMVGNTNVHHDMYSYGLDSLNVFLEKRKMTGNPVIYCSYSTFFSTESTTSARILDIFKRRTDLDLIMGFGGKTSTDLFGILPENILLLDYAPQIEVLKHASITLTHGGISTINESLFYGVPLIACSGGNVDQNGNCARIAFHGVGLRCNSNPIDSIELEWAIDYILGEKGNAVVNKVVEIQKCLHEYRHKKTVSTSINEIFTSRNFG